jgi:hypothetical protein
MSLEFHQRRLLLDNLNAFIVSWCLDTGATLPFTPTLNEGLYL